jgi:hypothetical protein
VEISGSGRVDELEHVVGEVARTLGRGKRSISFTRPRLLDRASQQPAADRPRGTGSRAVLSSGLRQRSGLRMGTSARPGATRAPKSTCSPPASCPECAPLTASSEEGRRSSMRTCFITNAIVAVDRVPDPTACTAAARMLATYPGRTDDPPKENHVALDRILGPARRRHTGQSSNSSSASFGDGLAPAPQSPNIPAHPRECAGAGGWARPPRQSCGRQPCSRRSRTPRLH